MTQKGLPNPESEWIHLALYESVSCWLETTVPDSGVNQQSSNHTTLPLAPFFVFHSFSCVMFVDSFALFPIFLCITYILCCFLSAPVLYSPAFMQVFFKSCYVAALRRRGAGNWISSQCSQFRRWLGGAGGSDDDSEEKVPEGKEQQPSRFEVGLRWHKSGYLKSSMVSSSKLHHFHYWLCVSLIWVAVPACMSRSFIERARTFFVPLATALKRSRGLIMGLCLSLPLEEHLKRALEKIEKDRCFNCGEFLRDTRLKLPEAMRTKLFWSNLAEFSSPSSKDCPKVPLWFQLRQLSPNLPCLFSSGFDALQEHECEALDWQEWENHLASISHFCGQDRKGPGLWDLHGHCNLAEHCVARTGKGAIFIGTSALLYARPKDISYVSIAHLCHAAFSNQPWPLVSVSHVFLRTCRSGWWLSRQMLMPVVILIMQMTYWLVQAAVPMFHGFKSAMLFCK